MSCMYCQHWNDLYSQRDGEGACLAVVALWVEAVHITGSDRNARLITKSTHHCSAYKEVDGWIRDLRDERRTEPGVAGTGH